jgi:Glucodextranase, domain B/PASTA domain
MGSLCKRMAIGIAVALIGAGLAVPAQAAAAITGSTLTAPADGSELFYDGDDGTGSVMITGTVTGGTSGDTADLYCYTVSDTVATKVASGIAVGSGVFAAGVSLSPIAGQACRLRLVPSGTKPTGAAAAPFAGPRISVSDRFSHSSNGNLYGYYVLSGVLPWSFAFQSLGDCPIQSSYSTDPTTLGSFSLFAGNGCLPHTSGIAPNLHSRSAIQIDGLNAYAPASISALTAVAGFQPIAYSTAFDASHDTVTITETDIPTICGPPGGYPPVIATCPVLRGSGIVVYQTTTLLPGGQVARVSDRFQDVDGQRHALDLLFNQMVQSPAPGELPGFQFPAQSVFASHASPDSFTLFPSSANSIIVVSDSAFAPSVSNPIGAITYSRPPKDADFISSVGAQTSSFLMHYADVLPAGGSLEYDWSYEQAADASSLARIEQVERDRFGAPSVAISSPRQNFVTANNHVAVRGAATDLVGLTSVTVDRHGVSVGPLGGFQATVKLKTGKNAIVVTATNLAGNTHTTTVNVTYRPHRCTVPGLKGKPLAAARTALKKHFCSVGRVTRRRSTTVRSGRVISSSPNTGHAGHAGLRVRLVVSRGP